MKRVVILLSIIFSLNSCWTWKGFVTESFDTLTKKTTISTQEFIADMFLKPSLAPTEIKDFQGVRTEFPGFNNYYLRYNADKEFVLNLVASMPAAPSQEIKSDDTCYAVDDSIDSFLSTGDDVSSIGFWHPDQVKNREFYRCLKYPWQHTILFDKDSNTVFHVIVETSD